MRALIALLFLAGCASGETEPLTAPPEAAVLGNAWIATHVDGEAVPDSVGLTFTFLRRSTGNGRFLYGGDNGCYVFGGSYAFTSEESNVRGVSVTPPSDSADAECSDAVQRFSEAFMDGIRAMHEVRHEGEQIWVSDSSGTERIAFRVRESFPVDLVAFRRGEWEIVGTSDPRVSSDASGTVSFFDSTFEGHSGCHWTRGTYAVERDNLIVLETNAGQEECSEGSRSRLPPIRTGKFVVRGDTLLLINEAGGYSLFVRPE